MEEEITQEEQEAPEESANQEGNETPDGEENPEENQEEEPASVPVEKFKSVAAQKAHWRDKYNELKDSKTQEPPKEQPQDAQEKQAEEYLTKLLDKRLEAREATTKAQQQKEQEKVEERLDFYEEVDPKFNADIAQNLISKYHLSYSKDDMGKTLHPVDIAYKMFKDGIGKESKPAKVPPKTIKSPRTSPTPQKPSADTSKSWGQLAEEAINEIE